MFRYKFIPIKVNKNEFKRFVGKKSRFKVIQPRLSTTEKVNKYNYYVYKKKVFKVLMLNRFIKYYFLNSKVLKFSSLIKHKIVYKDIPLDSRYIYLIKK